MFNTVFLYIMIRQVNLPETESEHTFFRRYPEFSDIRDVQERTALIQFRSILNVAKLIFDPSKGKKNLLHMVDRVCGGMHIPGVGQPVENNRRVLIYERETGVVFRKPQVISSRSGSLTDDSFLGSPCSGFSTTFAVAAVITPPAPPPLAPLQACAMHTIDSAEDTDGSRERQRLQQEQEAHTERLLEEGRAFWFQRARLMEEGRDIPCVFVPPQYAYAAFAYPPHDLDNAYRARRLPHHTSQVPRQLLPQHTRAHAAPQNAGFMHPYQSTYTPPQVRPPSHHTHSPHATQSNNTPRNSQW